MLGCMLRPTSGTITIHGECVSDLDERPAAVGAPALRGLHLPELQPLRRALRGGERRGRAPAQGPGAEDARHRVAPSSRSRGARQARRLPAPRHVRRRAPARLDRAGARRRSAPHPGRRAHRQPGRQERRTGDEAAPCRDALGWPHRDHRDARSPGDALHRPQRPHRGRAAGGADAASSSARCCS